jgi:hypothetical protein
MLDGPVTDEPSAHASRALARAAARWRDLPERHCFVDRVAVVCTDAVSEEATSSSRAPSSQPLGNGPAAFAFTAFTRESGCDAALELATVPPDSGAPPATAHSSR